ncbi:MAG: tetrathionate reductase family octaheme c-type cytochrome [Desulfobulbaceae bacterium]
MMKKPLRPPKLRFIIAPLIILLFFAHPFPGMCLEKHRGITGPFASLGEVTRSCLQCHRSAAEEVISSTHWTWMRDRVINGEKILYGKKDSLTSFAVDVTSNPERCMACHISTTRPRVDLTAPAPELVDCLVCHDTTGIYRHTKPEDRSSGDYERMARSVGRPSPANCTVCHFADCGLPGADQSGITRKGSYFNDIHLDPAIAGLTCQECHKAKSGHIFSRTVERRNGFTSGKGCEACHTTTPHRLGSLNRHTASVACQTCHIPSFAPERPVIIGWNWLMTGKSNRVYRFSGNERFLAQDENGFTFSTLLEPSYLWDDGSDVVYARGQRVRPRELTYLQRPTEKKPASKIMPFRVIYSTQLYDTKYRYLISPLLRPEGSSFFPGSDWEAVAREGMRAIVLPFSGEFAFAPTAAFRRINHGVVPAEEALDCLDCHGARGRMDWSSLGFDRDPWSGEPVDTGTENLGTGASETAPGLLPQPVKESLVPAGSAF